MRIYVFGNPLVKEDGLPRKILPALKKSFPKIEFIAADPNENFPAKGEKNIIILDAVKGLNKPRLLGFDELENIANTPVSPHDYDLMLHLQLLRKLKRIDKVKIIGLPIRDGRFKLVNKIREIISTLLLGNVKHKTYRGQRHG